MPITKQHKPTNLTPAVTRGQARRAAILKAAKEAFLEHGFGGATLDHVISRSGGSRATLYAQFENKEGLFAALIADVCERIVSSLNHAVAEHASIEKTLYTFGRLFMSILMTPDSLGLYRLVVAESARFPALGRQVFNSGPETAAKSLADYFRSKHIASQMKIDNPALAAKQFLEMVKGDLHTRALFCVGPPPSKKDIDVCVKAAVEVFLNGALTRAK